MKKIYKIILVVIVILLILLGGILCYHFFFSNKSKEQPPITNITTVTNEIEGYQYTLDDRDGELFQKLFQELKEVLEKEKIDEELYIELISKLFIIDLFTLDNKTSKYDIGGLEFLKEEAKESFRAKVLDSIYKTVEDNSYNNRQQNLPIVKNIEVEKKEKSSYKIGNEQNAAYEISLKWEYEENLGYDTKAKIIVVKEENKWSIISYQPIK